jgi:hypothetical protein
MGARPSNGESAGSASYNGSCARISFLRKPKRQTMTSTRTSGECPFRALHRLPQHALFALICFAAGSAHAGCSNPAGNEADMAYNSDNHTMQFCDGTNWKTLGAGVSSNRNMVTGWPDAIVCNLFNPNWGKTVFYATHLPFASDGLYYYRMIWIFNNDHNSIIFNSDGSFHSYHNLITTDCNASISTLYSNGNAFNTVSGP